MFHACGTWVLEGHDPLAPSLYPMVETNGQTDGRNLGAPGQISKWSPRASEKFIEALVRSPKMRLASGRKTHFGTLHGPKCADPSRAQDRYFFKLAWNSEGPALGGGGVDYAHPAHVGNIYYATVCERM